MNESEALITVMSEFFFFCEGFSLGHVIITTTIITWNKDISVGELSPKYIFIDNTYFFLDFFAIINHYSDTMPAKVSTTVLFLPLDLIVNMSLK